MFTFLIAAAGSSMAWRLGGKGPNQGSQPDDRSVGSRPLCFAAPLANPYGSNLPATWLTIMESKAVSKLIQEQASTLTLLQQGDAASFATITLLLCLGSFYCAPLAGSDRKDQRATWLIPLVWFFLSLARIRHAPIFAVMTVVAVADIFSHCRWVRSLEDRGLVTLRIRQSGRKSRKPVSARYVLAALVPGVALLTFHGSAQLPSTGQKWVKLDGTH
jgi:hypothetical protein